MTFSIIVPAYKEGQFLYKKMKNLMDLKYPSKNVHIIVASGGMGYDRVKTEIRGVLMTVIAMQKKGKINQLNEALKHVLGDIVVVTDADATVSSNALHEIDKAMSDKSVACVGLKTTVSGIFIDRIYWKIANAIRSIESWLCSSSHVVAPCYAFRSDLIKRFPDDVIADDFYSAMLANSKGMKVKFISSASAHEHRAPMNIAAFWKHKMRKGNAVLRELLRFLHCVNTMRPKFLIIYAIRIFQFTVLTPTVLFPYLFFKQGSCYEKVSS